MIKLANFNGQPEIFHSIQGEGKNMGQDSVFIRLSLCNLYCVWCDTDYTWNWEGTDFTHVNDSNEGYKKFNKSASILRCSNDEIIEEIEKHECLNLIFTGGEPLVQHKELVSLLEQLKEKNSGYRIAFETNGTIQPGAEMDALTDQYNVSVKLSNSKVKSTDRIKPNVIKFFANSPKANFKFVIQNEVDLEEVLLLVSDYAIDSRTVYLMPEGRTAPELKEKEEWLNELCRTHGFNYTTRLHVEMFGDKRGV